MVVLPAFVSTQRRLRAITNQPEFVFPPNPPSRFPVPIRRSFPSNVHCLRSILTPSRPEMPDGLLHASSKPLTGYRLFEMRLKIDEDDLRCSSQNPWLSGNRSISKSLSKLVKSFKEITLEGWSGTQLAVALAATTWGQRFVLLVISVVYRGCAVPIVWKIIAGRGQTSVETGMAGLVESLARTGSSSWTVVVLADRGLYAKWLFEAINGLGGHPMLRVTIGGSFRPEGWYHWVPFRQWVATVGQRWQGRGTAFTQTKTRLNCTLLGCWEPGHDQPWLILTDVPPQAADACGYGLRAWIEQGFKRMKSGGWPWQYTRMTDPPGPSAFGWRSPSQRGGCYPSVVRPKPRSRRRRFRPFPVHLDSKAAAGGQSASFVGAGR